MPIPIRYDQLTFDEGFRADLLVEDKVIVELKSVEKLIPVHSKQLLTQLRLSDRLGRLINFGEVRLKDGIERIVNGLPEIGCGGFTPADNHVGVTGEIWESIVEGNPQGGFSSFRR